MRARVRVSADEGTGEEGVKGESGGEREGEGEGEGAGEGDRERQHRCLDSRQRPRRWQPTWRPQQRPAATGSALRLTAPVQETARGSQYMHMVYARASATACGRE